MHHGLIVLWPVLRAVRRRPDPAWFARPTVLIDLAATGAFGGGHPSRLRDERTKLSYRGFGTGNLIVVDPYPIDIRQGNQRQETQDNSENAPTCPYVLPVAEPRRGDDSEAESFRLTCFD